MFDKLINFERPCREPEYSYLSEQIDQLHQNLANHLTPQSKEQLRQLADMYMRRETLVLRDGFMDGFQAAIELVLELYRRKGA